MPELEIRAASDKGAPHLDIMPVEEWTGYRHAGVSPDEPAKAGRVEALVAAHAGA